MKELIKNALILCIITVVAGVLLGTVYEVTKEPREEQKRLAKENAYREVMENAASFETIVLGADEKAAVDKVLGERGITEKNVMIDECVRAFDKDKNETGYVITVTSKEGYGGNITFSVGISGGLVQGVSILSISETAGLGMNAKDESFLSQYKTAEEGSFVVNKSADSEGINIDAISGATITSNAMTKGVNAAKAVYEALGMKGGEADE